MRRPLAIALVTLTAAAALPVLHNYAVVASYTVDDRPGSQTDPHVSGDLVAYTDEAMGSPEVRVAALSGGGAATTIADGWFSDISGNRVVFTRLRLDSTCLRSSIHVYDASDGSLAELAPAPCSARTQAAIGAGTVVWVDSGLGQSAAETEIVAFDLAAQQAKRLTNDADTDEEPAVAPDGNAIAWKRCKAGGTGCDILHASRSGGAWTTSAITGGEGEEHRPATDGSWIAYESVRTNAQGIDDRDIWYQPITGGVELQVPLTDGVQQNASVAGGLIAFESRPDGLAENFDIYLYDTRSHFFYRLTDSPDNERLTDIDVDPQTGIVTVVYVRNQGGDENIYAFSFTLAEAPPSCDLAVADVDLDGRADDQDTCNSPGSREAVGTLTLTRAAGTPNDPPNVASTTFQSTPGSGLLCVRNGSSRRPPVTTGQVNLNGEARFGSSDFQKRAGLLEARVNLQQANVLSGAIGGEPGTSYTVTVYGPPVCGGGTLRAESPLRDIGFRKDELRIVRGRFSSVEGLAGGCSSSSGGASLAALLLLGALFLRPRVAPARARRIERR